jgi:methyl-accepting chemotaxis protein
MVQTNNNQINPMQESLSAKDILELQAKLNAISKSQAIIEFDLEGNILTANDNFLTAMGYRLGEIIGKHHSLFISNEYKQSAEYKKFWQLLNDGEYQNAQFLRLGKNNKQVWLQASYNPILDLNGKPYKVVKYATNITSHKQAIEIIKNNLAAISNGNLQQKIEQPLTGDFNIVGDSLNTLTDNLLNLISEIKNNASFVFNDAKEIAQGTYELSHRTESQAASLEETASAMEELTSTVKQNAKNATDATAIAKNAMHKAHNGSSVIQQAVSAMADITKASKKIADNIGVIDEIAFTTNLLALNAAVEAARAGDQGRGFAVVAAEVRNLAQRSAAAAKEIKSLIIESDDSVASGSHLVNQSGTTFNELVAAVQEVVTMIEEIDHASNEQATGINEVSQAVAQMDTMTQQNAALVEEASASTKSLEQQAQALLEQVSFFNTK